MTRFEVDRACGQTPCLCGDVDTWHSTCFTGKAPAEIAAAEYGGAYRAARKTLQRRAQQMLASVMERVKAS